MFFGVVAWLIFRLPYSIETDMCLMSHLFGRVLAEMKVMLNNVMFGLGLFNAYETGLSKKGLVGFGALFGVKIWPHVHTAAIRKILIDVFVNISMD